MILLNQFLKFLKYKKKHIKYQLKSKEFYYDLHSKYSKTQGCLVHKRDVPLIISITTFGKRINKVYLCIETLLRQTVKPDYIILWLSNNLRNEKLPSSLIRLIKRGLIIKFCNDIGPYKKIIYTLKENRFSIIVTADDDVFYPSNWLQLLYEAYLKDPQYIYCHRAHLINKKSDGTIANYDDWDYLSQGIIGPSLRLFPTGVGGVLYPPGSLHDEVHNEEIFMKLSPYNDDIWLKAMSLLNGVPCKKIAAYFDEFTTIRGTQSEALFIQNALNNKNDKQLKSTFDHYKLHKLIQD